MPDVSIPERAREIAEKYWTDDDSWSEPGAVAEEYLAKLIAEAMRSERELCAKELEANGTIYANAAKLLRQGGQK